MKSYFRVALVVIAVFFGYHAAKYELGGHDIGIFNEVNYFSLALLIVLTIATLLMDTSYYKLDKRIFNYAGSFIVLACCLFVSILMFHHRAIDKSATILKVEHLPGADHVLTFEFKKNNKFRLTDHELFGKTIFYGRYRIEADTIMIIRSNYSGNAGKLPRKGFIKADTVYWEKFDTMLVKRDY